MTPEVAAAAATATTLSARDWRAAEGSLQEPAFARFGVDLAKGRRRSGDCDNIERSRLAAGRLRRVRRFRSRGPEWHSTLSKAEHREA
jgi:hypothetical protein